LFTDPDPPGWTRILVAAPFRVFDVAPHDPD
jgi:hypothetical protein